MLACPRPAPLAGHTAPAAGSESTHVGARSGLSSRSEWEAAPRNGRGDINKLNKLTSTTKVGIFSGIDGRDACLLRVVRVPCVLQRVRCQALQGVIQVREAQEEPRGACQANHRRKSFRVARSTWNSLGGFHSQCARQGVPDASSHRDRSG